MAHGVLSGIGLGAVFSITVAGIVSVVVPVEPQRAPDTGLAGTVAQPETVVPQANVVVTDENGSTPSQPQVAMRAPVSEELPNEPVAAARAPQVATSLGEGFAAAAVVGTTVTAPASETASVAPKPAPVQDLSLPDTVPQVPLAPSQPETGVAGILTEPRPLPESVIARVADDEPVLPNPLALAPMIPDDSVDADVPDQTVPDAVGAADPAAETEPQTAAATEEDAVEVPVVKPRVLPAPDSRTASVGASVPGTAVRPRIGTPANSLINRTAGADGVESVTQIGSGVARGDQPISRYAQPFENPEALPLMSIVLMDTGADLDAAEIGLPALSSFPYPVSFAVDVSLPDAADRVARYRAEGFDVLAMVNLPQGAQPTDAEVTMSVALNGMPEIVGVLEGTGEGLQGSREVADQVTRILQASGHGLVTQNKGLNSMPKLALKEGVPAAPVFRDFDSEGQGARVIRRFLDQAAFKAGQEGGVIMLGRLRPETIEALLVWGLADRVGSVALAPVSAVLLGQQ